MSTTVSQMKRRVLLDAAMSEFESKGLDKASLRSIAAKAGMTTGAIYSMFGGKTDLYAALLSESLSRLEAHVAERTAAVSDPLMAVRTSVMAFYEYYKDRLFEAQLGMHSFEGFRQGSLGPAHDAELNAALIRTLDIIGDAIARAEPDLSREVVVAERNAMFSALLGTLVLAHTGRALSVQTTPDVVMETQVQALLWRLTRK